MERKLIYICTEDIVYGKRLLQYVTGKSEPYVEFGLLTNFEKWENIRKSQNVIGLLIDDTGGTGREPPDGSGKIISLTASEKNNKSNSICKYQKAEFIYQEIFKKFQITDIRSGQFLRAKEVILIFAPKRGKEGLSYLAHKISTSSHNQKSIYINLSCLSFYPESITFDSNTAGLSDLILALEEEEFGVKVKECTVFYAETDMIPPVRHYKDLQDIKTDDVLLLISRLQQECGYQTCYIECCELYEFTFPLFAFADRILIVGITKEEWGGLMERYLQTEGMDHLENKYFWIDHNAPDSMEKGSAEAIYEGEEVSYEYGEYKRDRQRADRG